LVRENAKAKRKNKLNWYKRLIVALNSSSWKITFVAIFILLNLKGNAAGNRVV
jgi:hypothetical protein